MRVDLTAILRRSEFGFVASCAEVPGTEIEAATEQEALESLMEAVSIVFEVNRIEAMREAGWDAKRCPFSIDLEELDEGKLLQMDEDEVAVSS